MSSNITFRDNPLENAVTAKMRYEYDSREPWIVETFDAGGKVLRTWTRITRPDGLLANINRHLSRREGDED